MTLAIVAIAVVALVGLAVLLLSGRGGEGVRAARAEDVRGREQGTQRRHSRKRAAEPGRAEDTLTAAIGRLMAVAEQYPELRATENFQPVTAR